MDASQAVDEMAATASGSCCSTFYEQDWVRYLAEDSFHPGGAELTGRTVAAMNLPEHATLLDLGCGTGTSALHISEAFHHVVAGVDASKANVGRAIARTDGQPVRFVHADAQDLPFYDGEFDGVLAECVFSLFADKPGALAEIRRVLQPGGRVGLTDMSVAGALPDEIARVIAPWTCLADAPDRRGYEALFAAAGFEVAAIVDESAALASLLGNLKRKLLLIGTGSLAAGEPLPDLDGIKFWLDRCSTEVANGSIRYIRFQLQS